MSLEVNSVPSSEENWVIPKYRNRGGESGVAHDIKDCIHMLGSWKGPLSLPDTWAWKDGDVALDAITCHRDVEDTIFRTYLDYVLKHSLRTVLFQPLCYFKDHSFPYPEPNVLLTSYPDRDPRSVKKGLSVLFASSSSFTEELAFKVPYLDCFSAFFQVPGCSVMRSTSPDANLVTNGNISSHGFAHDIPLLAAVQCDMGLYEDNMWWRPDHDLLQSGRRRLIAILEPTLKLFVSVLQPKDDTDVPATFPGWCFVQGLLYDQYNVQTYSHYPRWNSDNKHWEFVSDIFDEDGFEAAFYGNGMGHRVPLAFRLLSMQRHAVHVRDELSKALEGFRS